MITYTSKDNKYKVTFDEKTGKLVAYRYGEPWRDLCGDNLVLAMLSHINALEEELGVIYGLDEGIGGDMSTDEQDNIIRLTEEGFDSVLEALENPPPVSDKLKAAAKKLKEEGFCYSHMGDDYDSLHFKR